MRLGKPIVQREILFLCHQYLLNPTHPAIRAVSRIGIPPIDNNR